MSMDLDEQYDRIYRYCYYKVHNSHTAEDITQETFLRFFQRYSGKIIELPYLYTIARNLCIDEYRRSRHEEICEPDEEAGYDPSDIWTENIVLKRLISDLDEEEREILLLRYANGLSVKSICMITGLSRFAVHRRITAAVKTLRTELEKGDI